MKYAKFKMNKQETDSLNRALKRHREEHLAREKLAEEIYLITDGNINLRFQTLLNQEELKKILKWLYENLDKKKLIARKL